MRNCLQVLKDQQADVGVFRCLSTTRKAILCAMLLYIPIENRGNTEGCRAGARRRRIIKTDGVDREKTGNEAEDSGPPPPSFDVQRAILCTKPSRERRILGEFWVKIGPFGSPSEGNQKVEQSGIRTHAPGETTKLVKPERGAVDHLAICPVSWLRKPPLVAIYT